MDLQENPQTNTRAPEPPSTSSAASAARKVDFHWPPADARDATAMLSRVRDVPALVESELKENPYRMLGIATAVGFGLGLLASSRITRMLLISVGSYAAQEVLKSRVKTMLLGANA